MGAARLRHYLAWNYLRDLPLGDNETFSSPFPPTFGAGRPVQRSDGNRHTRRAPVGASGQRGRIVRTGQSHLRPAAAKATTARRIISVDPDSQHLWKPICIARIPDGRLGIVHYGSSCGAP